MIFIEILNRMLVVIYVLACLNVTRHLYKLFASWTSTEGDGETIRYILEERKLILVGLSIAYIISGFFTGITL
tara:strand:- start:81 stop:299 length:219 start_codon:yes stop_codon:yes gene_type:complete